MQFSLKYRMKNKRIFSAIDYMCVHVFKIEKKKNVTLGYKCKRINQFEMMLETIVMIIFYKVE